MQSTQNFVRKFYTRGGQVHFPSKNIYGSAFLILKKIYARKWLCQAVCGHNIFLSNVDVYAIQYRFLYRTKTRKTKAPQCAKCVSRHSTVTSLPTRFFNKSQKTHSIYNLPSGKRSSSLRIDVCIFVIGSDDVDGFALSI